MKRWILCFLILVLLCTMPVSALPEEAFCATEEEYLAALIAAKQSAEPRSFVSFEMRVSEELLDALYADNCALQHQLELQSGMVEAHEGSTSGVLIRYRNCVFDDEAFYAEDLLSLQAALIQGARECRDKIYVVCDEPLLKQISGDLWAEMQWLCIEGCGMTGMAMLGSYCTMGILPVLCVPSPSYHESYLLLRALETGNTSSLSAEEQQALKTAQAWAAEISPGNAEDVMRQIHDMICARVRYDWDNELDFDQRHSCLGALLEGACVCEGYADTFYLLGTLCGLDVRIQTGTVPTEGNSSRGNHSWNWVQVNGGWRLVDVTLDDQESGTTYDYFNIPISSTPEDHVWVWGPDGMRS